MAIIGCYTLALYCDTGGDAYGVTCPYRARGEPLLMHEFTGPNYRDCMRQARRAGWSFTLKHNAAWCPKCTAETKRPGG